MSKPTKPKQSRSVQRRVAIQEGQKMPTFDKPKKKAKGHTTHYLCQVAVEEIKAKKDSAKNMICCECSGHECQSWDIFHEEV